MKGLPKQPGPGRRPRSWQEIRKQEIRWLIDRTGDGLETWNARVREQGFSDREALRAWLTEHGVTGYPQMLLVMERFGYPDYLQATADQLINRQYADGPDLRPILDGVLRLPATIGLTHKIGLHAAEDVDDEVEGWLRLAYEERLIGRQAAPPAPPILLPRVEPWPGC